MPSNRKLPTGTGAVGAFSSVVRTLGRGLLWVSPLAIAAVIWEAISAMHVVSPTVLPPFTEIVRKIASMLAAGEIFTELGTSVYRAIVGLVIGCAVGVLLGVAMGLFAPLKTLLQPIVSATYALPKSALIPITLLWLGVGNSSIILCVIIGTAVPMVVSAYEGAIGVPLQHHWSARSMGAGRFRVFMSVTCPGALPHIMNGLRVALPLSFILVISAEMIAAFVGVGKYIYTFGQAGAYADMFAAIIITMVVAFAFSEIVSYLSRRALRWSESGGSDV